MANDNNKILSSIFSVLVSGHHASCLESAAGSTVAQILVPERPGDERQPFPEKQIEPLSPPPSLILPPPPKPFDERLSTQLFSRSAANSRLVSRGREMWATIEPSLGR